MRLLKDIGEQGLLAIIQEFCPKDIIGDDGAVLAIASEHNLVVTTDVLVEGVHFSNFTIASEDVGWKAVTANFSDLAAMGATPLGITVGLSLPEDTSVVWIESLYRGMGKCLEYYNASLLGGDLSRSSTITISITALGQVLPNRVITRFVAQPNDAIVVTGTHGASQAGLDLFLKPKLIKNLDEKIIDFLIKKHQCPKPRLDVVEILTEIIPSSSSIAGMDSSDGLADAIIQICRCSQVGAIIDSKAIPMSPELLEFVDFEKALEYALYGGEDFELVLCLPLKLAKKLVKKIGKEAAIIGKITKDKSVKMINGEKEQELNLSSGFKHF